MLRMPVKAPALSLAQPACSAPPELRPCPGPIAAAALRALRGVPLPAPCSVLRPEALSQAAAGGPGIPARRARSGGGAALRRLVCSVGEHACVGVLRCLHLRVPAVLLLWPLPCTFACGGARYREHTAPRDLAQARVAARARLTKHRSFELGRTSQASSRATSSNIAAGAAAAVLKRKAHPQVGGCLAQHLRHGWLQGERQAGCTTSLVWRHALWCFVGQPADCRLAH